MSGPSGSTLFFKILNLCSHNIPFGDSYYDPNLAGFWLWARLLGDELEAHLTRIMQYLSLATSPGTLILCAPKNSIHPGVLWCAQSIKIPGDVAKLSQ